MSAKTHYFSRFASPLGRALAVPARRLVRKRVLAKLNELDDRLLADIGLTRIDLEHNRRMW